MPERHVYEVIRPFQGDKSWKAGDLITDYEGWPFGRAEQLIELRLVRPTVITVDEEMVEAQPDLAAMNVGDLRAYAKEMDIDLTGVSRRDDILARIREADHGNQSEPNH